LEIIFAVLNDKDVEFGKSKLLQSGAAAYKIAEKMDWKTFDMPDQQAAFILQRSFSDRQMQALRKGNIPKEMEDKWFWYMEGNTLYAHRSWTGFCIYIISFSEDGNHTVTVNRELSQYKETIIEKDEKLINNLLDWWSK
jgi:8-oxo-dGTP diphosphatase